MSFDRSKFMSKRNKKSWKDPKYRKRMEKMRSKSSKAMWKKHRKKMSKIVAKNCKLGELWRTSKFRKKHAKACKSKEFSKRSRINIKKLWKRKSFRRAVENARSRWSMPVEARKRASKRMKRLWKDPKQAKSFAKNLRKGRGWPFNRNKNGRYGPSKVQWKVFDALRDEGIRGLKQEHIVGRYSLDIVNKRKKIDIEVDGYSFHDECRDAKRDKVLKKLGWKVVRVKVRREFVSKSDFNKILEVLR